MDSSATDGTAAGAPIWQNERADLERPPLDGTARCDVCVVGAGIFGLTTAYLLQRAGRRTLLLDDGPVAGGQTARTTAHLATALDGRYADIERIHGGAAARLAAQSHLAAIAAIEGIVRDEQITCELRRIDGYLFPADDTADDLRFLHDEHAAAARAGLEVELLARTPVAGLDGGPCVRFAGQGRLHPLRYLAGVARAFERAGGRIHGSTHVGAVQGGRAARVTTRAGRVVDCGAVVVATNAPINDRLCCTRSRRPT